MLAVDFLSKLGVSMFLSRNNLFWGVLLPLYCIDNLYVLQLFNRNLFCITVLGTKNSAYLCNRLLSHPSFRW